MKRFLVMLTVAALLLSTFTVEDAYSHGLGRGESIVKSVGNKIAKLYVELVPEMKRYGSMGEQTLMLELKDAESNEGIKGVGYELRVSRFATNELLLHDRFYSSTDKATINFQPTMDDTSSVEGKRNESGFYIADGSEPLTVRGKAFRDAGLYRIEAKVLAIDGNMLEEAGRASYELLITLSEVREFNVAYEGKEYSIETISYFDAISDFNFDPASMSIRAVMPFNWDREFVQDIPLFHFEFYISKEFHALANKEFKGMLNGVEEPITVDRAAEGFVVVHYMTPKNRLLSIADKVLAMPDAMRDSMIVELVPVGDVNDGASTTQQEGGQVDLSTLDWSPVLRATSSKGSILVEMQFAPSTINVNDTVYFRFTFKDPKTGEELKNVRYDVMLYDAHDKHIDRSHRSKTMRTVQVYDGSFFTEQGNYTLLLTDVNDTGESARFSITVVPEFPLGIAIVIASISLLIVALMSRLGYPIKLSH
ncbi:MULTISPECIES: hypothetical protein [Candidatus Nitrosocaldus]|jgi:hypothetical protein|uniref:Putative S-layer domain protein n=1 Tax=Candidatus Nitrosocaldus cavascurensis TaxID=2058097 RepID=A0A2K5ASX3_9ARCH|nr:MULTISPECIES: hypothetical protein [Candidatus Nitrosocaldus]SPC34742.1 putative S-layer domain protein [Candidatus Nitrosocaldus cavascurensis]